MPLPFAFDFKNPDYVEVFEWRAARLKWLREHPEEVPLLKLFYKENPAQFIIDWGMTYDPRLARRNLPTMLPFILFPKQEELVAWILERWKDGEGGLIPKSRDMGISWLLMGLSDTLCLFNDQVSIGWGSRKADLVDSLGDLDSLLEKGRMFLSMLPIEFRGGWNPDKHTSIMKIEFPESGSIITGEGGDNIGRGGRKTIYFLDEAAHIDRPKKIDAALSANTDCRIDLSSVNGTANPFAQKRARGHIKQFIFHWRDDPRKDDAWYEKQKYELDSLTLAQEIDMDENASEGGLIPSSWVQAAVDACARLGIKPTGSRRAALDVADEGMDMNALCGMHGVQIEHMAEWSGRGGDIYETVQHAFQICDENRYHDLRYDGDGLGAGVRGDAKNINAARAKSNVAAINVEPFRGSESVINPESKVDGTDRTNEDYFANRKAQAWWNLRSKFKNTYRWVVEGIPCNPDEIISIAPNCPNRQKLIVELSQPTYKINDAGKIIINKKPDGTKSPNLADSVMIANAGNDKKLMKISAKTMQAMQTRTAR
jgi:hypothetical protein